jgi:hypothetical protein
MQGQASEYLYGIVALRELFNRPVIAGEFGTYDYTAGSPQNDDYFMNVMRMSELLGVPWWSYDVYGLGLTQDWNYIIPVPYTSNLVPPYVPVPFDAVCLPFNMISYISGWNRREIGYNTWGVSYYQFASGNDYIIFSKPCKVRITTWDNPDDFYAGRPPTRETIVSMAAGSRLNIANYYSPGFTFAFAYWVPRLTIKSSPISGVPITVDEQAVDGTSITIPLEEGSHQISVPTEVEA